MNKNQNKKKREQEAKTELAQKIANQSQKVATGYARMEENFLRIFRSFSAESPQSASAVNEVLFLKNSRASPNDSILPPGGRGEPLVFVSGLKCLSHILSLSG